LGGWMSIIYGLGNPGSRYQATRHNIGYLVIDRLSSRWKVKLNAKASGLVYGRAKIEGMDVILAKPLTYMNLSGEPLGVHGVEARDLVVIYDDLDLPWGTIRVRPHGSSGGARRSSACAVASVGHFRVWRHGSMCWRTSQRRNRRVWGRSWRGPRPRWRPVY